MEIRALGPGDEQAVVAAQHLLDGLAQAEATAAFLADPRHHLLIAHDGDRPVGFVSGVELLHPDKGVEMLLSELGVEVPARRRGIGRALVGALAELAARHGCYDMYVLVDHGNPAALATYRSSGARESSRPLLLEWTFRPDGERVREEHAPDLPLPAPSPEAPVRGSCLCGGVRYEVTAPFLRANLCHCTRCRKHTGAAASAQGRVPRAAFRLLAGGELLRSYRPDHGMVKAFCTACGSSLFGGSWPDGPEVSIPLGTLDDDPGIRPQLHTFVADAPPWLPLAADGLPRHAAGPQPAGRSGGALR